MIHTHEVDKLEISIVSPVYGAAEVLHVLVDRINEEVAPLTSSYEILLVEDGSPGADWQVIREICARQPKVRGVKLTRNFGQQVAICAGLSLARGTYVVVMDCDLQDNPKFIPDLIAKARDGFDVVWAERGRRGHGLAKNLQATVFHFLFSVLSSIDRSDPAIGSFSVLSRLAVDSYLDVAETNTPYNVVVGWLNLKTSRVPVKHESRATGRSSYTFAKLVRHALVGLAASSDRLLLASVSVGLAFVVASMVGALAAVVRYALHGARPGWTSLTVLISLSTGLILLSTGVLGIYLGKVIELVRDRPAFRFEEILN